MKDDDVIYGEIAVIWKKNHHGKKVVLVFIPGYYACVEAILNHGGWCTQ